ncbi:Transcription factor TFIIIB component B [Geranomyces variabilis]|uniref:Transcription factor TFIIIB component B n=1 Tax=Geranomyces variabilis TaxID=109894 RepID=A0AAD5TUB4_9FUNG|nr:Transcription factor TFIIIB component B [Geranomyces variabilis]
MVELTLSGVTRGPGKFAPAPKVKPRPGRARGAAAPAAGGPAASASAASATPTPSSTPAPDTPPASIEPPADAAAPLTKVAAAAPRVLATPAATKPNVGPSVPSTAAPRVATAVTFKVDVPTSQPSTNATIPTVSATPLPTPSPVVRSVAKPVSAPFQLPTRASVPVVLSSRDTFNDHEEDPAEHISVPATTRINAPPRIVSTAPPKLATAPIPHANSVTEAQILPPTPATKPPVPKSNAPPKVMAASRANGNAIATPGRTRVEVVLPIPSPQQKASRSRAATAEVDAVEPAFDVEDHEEEMELNEYTIAYASLDTLIKHKFPAGKLSRAEELRRQQQKEARKRKGKEEREGTPGSVRDPTPAPEPVREATPAPVNLSGPRLIMVDGQLQLDKESLVIRTGATEEEDLELIEEASNRHVTSASFARPRTARVRWSADATDRFYEGLSYFGSDFSMICLMFPELNRKQIKQKYNAEERTNAKRVTKALLMKRETPSDLAGEMKERIKERVTKRKAKAHESDDEDELLAVKRAKSESAAKLEAGATPPTKVDEDDEDVMDLDEEPEQPQQQQTQAEDLIRSLIAQQEQLEELGAPTAVEVSMALPTRPSSSNIAGPSFKPRIAPKAGARKARSQPASAAASPASAPIPLPAPSSQQEIPPLAAAPDPTAGVPIVNKVSRVRMVPTIGAARKPQPPLPPS